MPKLVPRALPSWCSLTRPRVRPRCSGEHATSTYRARARPVSPLGVPATPPARAATLAASPPPHRLGADGRASAAAMSPSPSSTRQGPAPAGLPSSSGVLPAQRLREAIAQEWITAGAWRIPAGVRAAGQRRPAARREGLGAALQLPARQRLDGRAEGRGPGLRRDRPARRRHARARPPVPRPADRGAAPAAGRSARRPTPRARPAASTCSRAC